MSITSNFRNKVHGPDHETQQAKLSHTRLIMRHLDTTYDVNFHFLPPLPYHCILNLQFTVTHLLLLLLPWRSRRNIDLITYLRIFMRGLDHRPSIAQEATAAGVTMSFAFPPIHFRSLTQSAGGEQDTHGTYGRDRVKVKLGLIGIIAVHQHHFIQTRYAGLSLQWMFKSMHWHTVQRVSPAAEARATTNLLCSTC